MTKNLNTVFFFIDVLILVFCFLFSIKMKKSRQLEDAMSLFDLFFLVALLLLGLHILASIKILSTKYYYFANKVSVLFYFVFYFRFFYVLLNPQNHKNIFFKFSSILTVFGIIFLLLYINSNLPWYPLVLSNITLLIFSGMYFFGFFREDDFSPLSSRPEFWVVFGISISSVLMIPVSLFILVLEGDLSESYLVILSSINQLSFIIQYGSIIKAFLCISRIREK
jgi:hypothetical protein